MCFFISLIEELESAEQKQDIIAKSVYVYNLTDGKVETDVNLGNKKLPIASLTKLMTRRKLS